MYLTEEDRKVEDAAAEEDTAAAAKYKFPMWQRIMPFAVSNCSDCYLNRVSYFVFNIRSNM